MSTTTPNFLFTLPSVNNPIDSNIWGGYLNGDFTLSDSYLKQIITQNIGSASPTIPATSAPAAGMLWINNSSGSTGVWPLQVYDGSTWLTIGMIDPTDHIFSSTGTVAVNIQTFTTVGAATYTPSLGMSYCIVKAVGAGGGGGGIGSTGPTSFGVGGGGGAGGYAEQLFTIAEIGASQSLFIGTGGARGAGTGTGGTGGSTLFGSAGALLNVSGGIGGGAGVFSISAPTGTIGGAGGASIGNLGYLNVTGDTGQNGIASSTYAFSGAGGGTSLGGSTSGFSFVTNANASGINATNAGSGGSGGASFFPLTPISITRGGLGANGMIIITEYI